MAIYNMRRYIYANSEQIRLYRKPVIREDEERKEEQNNSYIYNTFYDIPDDFEFDKLKDIS